VTRARGARSAGPNRASIAAAPISTRSPIHEKGEGSIARAPALASVCAATAASLLASLFSPELPAAERKIAREQLVAADFRQGMLAFQQRCSACHSAAEGGTDLVGPNLYGVFERLAGSKPGFSFSATLSKAGFPWTPERLHAWISDPAGYLRGSNMILPEPVPEADRIALLSYLMLETGAADWPRPQMPQLTQGDGNAPLSERFPSFWNHLMTNTTRYRLEGPEGELRFDAYFEKDGAVRSSHEKIRGFWHVDERDSFCYALYGIPIAPKQLVECFPVVAMSIPRFNEQLWTSQPLAGIKLTGGIVAGRSEGTDAEAGYWKNLFENTMRYELAAGELRRTVDLYFNRDKSISSPAGARGAWLVRGAQGGEEMCYTFGGVAGIDGEMSECFALRLMYNPRIGARWPGKLRADVSYWAEVVAGRGEKK
jgi:cytochrome c